MRFGVHAPFQPTGETPMKVRDVMRRDVAVCRADENLAAVAATMWKRDVGVVPVVDDRGRAVGVITDRDIAIAVGTRHRMAADIAVEEVMSTDLASVRSEEDLDDALEQMRLRKVRRLPVLEADGTLVGILSIDDLAATAVGSPVDLSYQEVVLLLREMRTHGMPGGVPVQ